MKIYAFMLKGSLYYFDTKEERDGEAQIEEEVHGMALDQFEGDLVRVLTRREIDMWIDKNLDHYQYNKITRIVAIRALMGVGLKDAKEYVERLGSDWRTSDTPVWED